LANVDIPEVLSETPLPDSKTMFASYRMTRLPGQVMYGWDYFTKNYDPAQTAPHFRDVGALLANFHAIAAERLADVTPQSRPWFEWGSDIAQVPALGADINTELAAADRYLRANKQDGVAHGDFHTSNYMVDENFRITGLLDFSFSGRTDNDLIDFAAIPDAQRDVVLTEYERLSGRDIDRTLATVTALSLDARILHWATQNPDGAAAREDVLGRMQRRLDIVRPATMI
jgi:aminoglycoside phosphotransferase (APT) family kinase protein